MNSIKDIIIWIIILKLKDNNREFSRVLIHSTLGLLFIKFLFIFILKNRKFFYIFTTILFNLKYIEIWTAKFK
jgi:hypothetical protein